MRAFIKKLKSKILIASKSIIILIINPYITFLNFFFIKYLLRCVAGMPIGQEHYMLKQKVVPI